MLKGICQIGEEIIGTFYENDLQKTKQNEFMIEKVITKKGDKYIDFKKEVNDKNPKLKVGYHVRISKYKNSFAKGYMPNWSEEIFIIKKN